MSLKSDCRKFAPNIFNKTKCQNCFRGKDVHSAEALESNRATRKVCMCGYLFVAPDWDFSLPANRNKRWQRRWFVLYDDGELAYSVDECPETVPQAVIDMNCVLEVTDAENVTGNQFSLAITLPEKAHFIKGTSKEETKKWFEVLSRFPRNTVCGKYKRNATFPGVKAVSPIKTENNFTDWVNRRDTVPISEYTKTNNYINRNIKTQNSSVKFDPEDVIPTKDTNCSTNNKIFSVEQQMVKNSSSKDKQPFNYKVLNKDTFNLLNSSVLANVNSTYQRSRSMKAIENTLPPSNPKADVRDKDKFLPSTESSRKYAKQDAAKTIRRHHSRSDVTPMIPSIFRDKDSSYDWKKVSVDMNAFDCSSKNYIHNPVYIMMSDVPSGKKYENCEKFFNAEKPNFLQRQSSFGRKSDFIRQISSWSEDQVDGDFKSKTIHKSASVPNAVLSEDIPANNLLSNNAYLSEKKARQCLESKFVSEQCDKLLLGNPSLERGDPDGCNLDSLPFCSHPSEQNAETMSLKKGWLVKQEHNKWNKHWFVLRNSALTFYSDPIAEDAGILDGVVDLRKAQCVSEVQSNSGHTFCITMKDNSKLFLSAVTSKMRNNWIRAILQAAKLKSSSSEDIKKSGNLTVIQASKGTVTVTVKRNASISSADSENLSELSGKNTITEDEEYDGHLRNHSSIALPPSPPIARTAISRVKERARSRSHSHPRTSRYSTAEVHETTRSYLADSDDAGSDHSSSSLSNVPISLSKEEAKQTDSLSKKADEKCQPERRRSLKLSSSDTLPLPDRRKKVLEIKDKLEDSSWMIWLDISKFCKEVEAKLDDIESINNKRELSEPNNKNLDCPVAVDKKKEVGHLAVCLMKVEKRLHKVHSELEKAKVDLLMSNKERDLKPTISKSMSCLSSVEAAEVSGMSSQNVLLAQQLTKVKEENRRLKQDLKEAQDFSDGFELNCLSLKQELKQKQDLHQSQMDLMVARVDDLTMKLLNSEKNVRQLRQRVAKLEQRQERRRSSLKGKEALTLSKEYEAKLSELEQKICAVESALKPADDTCEMSEEPPEKTSSNKESVSLLIRLHNLDKKVKGVSEAFDQNTEEVVKVDDFMKPKIRLQVKLEDDIASQDTSEDWNSLSLSTSMTDLTSPDLVAETKTQNLTLTLRDCLENLNYKISSLVSWLRTNLQLMYDEGNSDSLKSISGENCKELKHVIQALEHASNSINNTAVVTQDINDIAGSILYKIVLLQEITNIVFRMSNFEKYKSVVLTQHLTRVKHTIQDLELYITQKSNSVNVSTPKVSLCNIVANFLFYRAPFATEDFCTLFSVEKLFDEVESSKKRVSSTIFTFKEKFIENFCATILELSANSTHKTIVPINCTDNLSDSSSSSSPLGQKQFLSHINHIITQVSHSFVSHISKSLNEMYFLCPTVQYSMKWTSHICKLLQQELVQLTTEIKTICIKHLESEFYSGSKCGVLVEYMHCSVWELAQIVSIRSLIEGTVSLIKDALHSTNSEKQMESIPLEDDKSTLVDTTPHDLDVFHQCLLQRAASVLSNLPAYPYLNASWSFCNSSEVNVAHRSVSSLLCFRQKLKISMENERKACQMQIDQINQKLNALREEQRKRESGGCRSCVELRQEVSYLQAELDESRALVRSGSLCDKCMNLKLEVQKLMEQHERDTFLINKLEEQEDNWKLQMQNVLHEKDMLFSGEKEKYESKLQSAQQLLKNMEIQYDKDMHNLQSLYEQKLYLPHNDVWRTRYISEIDQLKSLCEKGLEAMEITHKKLIGELETKHQKELDDLTTERERVLAEEARATAVALEAVRKAHKDELQKQVQLFKQDFMQKMGARLETEAFKKGYEAEMEKIKHEILAITEKYSTKCLENISLQESVEKMSEELKTSNIQILQLKDRNKQLQARLASDTIQKLEELV